MNVTKTTQTTLDQLEYILNQLTDQEYSRPIDKLGYSSIGQHVRHSLEFYICLFNGIETAMINYDKRKRDILLESSTDAAISTISALKLKLKSLDSSSGLTLEVNYSTSDESESKELVETNLKRELIYNIEHAIHHMAIIKIGIKELSLNINLPEDFGIATSTIKYRNSLQE